MRLDKLEISIVISSTLGEEKKVLRQLEKILRYSGCSEEEGMDIKTAVAEACLNAIEHGNGMNPDLSVNIHIQVVDNIIVVEVSDHGKGNELQAFADDETEKGEGARGRGLYMIDKLADAWEYFYNTEDQLFCVRIKKLVKAGKGSG